MAEPSAPSLSDPAGIHFDDGYSTRIVFSADTDIGLWMKTVTPPGWDGGDEIDITTMHNSALRTFAARSLATLTEFSTTCAWDPLVYDGVKNNLLNVETTVAVYFPDGTSLAFYGFLKRFEPGEMVEGEQPEATVTVQPTNRDPSTRTEEAPVLDNKPGT